MSLVELPWGAWYGDQRHGLHFSDGLSVDVLAPHDAPALTAREISLAIGAPVESPPVRDLARNSRSACLVVDDLARPTRASDVLAPLVEELREAGLPREGVRIVVATGSHGALRREQLEWKVGPAVVSQHPVECHDFRGTLAETGIEYGDRPWLVNRTFLESDLKIVIGSVLPHTFAGFSGGAKLVLPGLSDLAATARSHKFVQLGLRGGADPNENRFRLEAERMARQIGVRFAVCVVTNSRRETAGVFAGDLVRAHRLACIAARDVFRTPVDGPYDGAILNAYPKDIDLIQAENAFVALKTAPSPVVRDGGVVVLATAASEGLGRHGLFEPGGAGYRPPARKRALGDRELWIYAPAVSEADVRKLYWEGYPVFHDGAALTSALAQRLPERARIAVFPCAPTQQADPIERPIAGDRRER